ncbi:M20 family metallopeptidase [uncultured Propionibacterium sp.]|uniref:M20 metallopeptidase family protein n=1 Tax=uncultured Propionibacterium sp. TaxID=218066 RepID=UPI002930742E|nr:M20 family metallopeptidase [uncultured Propionibacterium sp.]
MSTQQQNASTTPDFRAMGVGLADHLGALRRELHQIPELGFDLPLTKARLLAELTGMPVEIHEFDGWSAFVVVVRGGRPGPVVLVRGDMDALPVVEDSGEDFASTNGAMHACGHDMHMSALVGAVKMIADQRAGLSGSVMFMFQPAEETARGAKRMLDEGLLGIAGERPAVAWGVHEVPAPAGTVHVRAGAQMASNCQLLVTFRGRGGHGSAPDTAIDPVPAVLDLGQQLQMLVTREFSVFDPVVCTVTRLDAGKMYNVIHDRAGLGATIRAISKDTTDRFGGRAVEIAELVGRIHRCGVEAEFHVNCPTTLNDPRAARVALEVARGLFGDDRVIEMDRPVMASEDFSHVLEQVPGAFLFMGALPDGVDPDGAPQLHSPQARYDSGVLGDQAALLAALAWTGELPTA